MHDNGMSKTFWDARALLQIHGIMVHHTDVASRVVDTAIQHAPSVGLLLNLWTVIKRSCTLGPCLDCKNHKEFSKECIPMEKFLKIAVWNGGKMHLIPKERIPMLYKT